jgi:hypothetical protein
MVYRLFSRMTLTSASVASVVLLASSAQAGTSWTLEPGPGDVVNIEDIQLIASNWLSTEQPGQIGSWFSGDYSGDGMVNINDLAVVASHWGETGQSGGSNGLGGAVPEPSTGLVFGIWALGLWLVRRCVRTS